MLTLLLALAASPYAHSMSDSRTGTLTGGCRSLDVIKLCFVNGNTSLLVAGRETRLLNDGWPNFLPYQITRKRGSYRVKIGLRSLSDIPFYHYAEITFHRKGLQYVVSRYTIVSENRCDGWPDLKVTYTIDFTRRVLSTQIDPEWTSDGNGRRYSNHIQLKTSDIHELSDEYLNAFIGNASANGKLCKDYSGGR